uniref:Myb-like domain-containing protein n=1 Tax=Kalanchoe fedtschenkoi TaxID=63787 RepID=A0A7N0SVY4_KALFE
KSSRSVKWTVEEEEMLITSWLTISNDSVIGNAQTRGSFWVRVTDYFNMYRKIKIEREKSQIKPHYYFLMPHVIEFNGYYNQIVSDHHSGWSDNQIIEVALLNWKNAHKNKEFPYMHIWEMKAKTSESGAYTSSSTHDANEYSYGGNESDSRPIGQRLLNEKLEEFQAKKLSVFKEIKNKVKDDTLRADYEILMKDTTIMSDQQLANHNHMCSIIKARHDIS